MKFEEEILRPLRKVRLAPLDLFEELFEEHDKTGKKLVKKLKKKEDNKKPSLFDPKELDI